MNRITIGSSLLLLCLLAGIALELARPRLAAMCAECGAGPRDPKCPTGYQCIQGKCVKK